ncbi:MAG: Holliday junction branch migration protein RuvA [Actinomycetes bacterium]
MIASVRGEVLDLSPDAAVIEVGGMGLAIQCTPPTLATLRRGDQATVHTSLIVREDSLTLYGFVDADERAVFEVVQTVSGVGPRLAQAIVAALRPDTLRQIVATEDIAALTQVPGIGKKGAQRLVLELKDKLGAPLGRSSSSATSAETWDVDGAGTWRSQVHAAMVGLGWSSREADAALVAVADEYGSDVEQMDVGVLLKTALRAMGPGLGR